MFTVSLRRPSGPIVPLLALCATLVAPSPAADGVKLTTEENKIRVEIGGKLFTEYHFAGERRPYFYPILSPAGVSQTRDWPLREDTAGEEHDHVHHRGLWYGHQHVNGTQFWEESPKPGGSLGRIVQEQLLEASSGPDAGVIRSRNLWIKDDGTKVVNDERTIRFHGRGDERYLDFDITFSADHGEVVFGADKDAAMATRVAETARVERPKEKGKKSGPKGEGHIVTSAGKRDNEAWGTRAKWCDYHGPMGGEVRGVAIFDHPANPRHPTWWHVRPYGLFAANPFAQAQFENLPDKTAGELKLAAGAKLTFRYRFYWHAGDEQTGKVAERYESYVKETGGKLSAK